MVLVIQMANLKGGVAKTTTTIQVAHNLAKKKKRVLVIDGDPDGCYTEACDVSLDETGPNIYDWLTNSRAGIAEFVRTYTGTGEHPVRYPQGGCVDFIPGSERISHAATAFDRSVKSQPVAQFEMVPNYIVQQHCQKYDYVLIDPSPSTSRQTTAWTYASHAIIAPVSVEAMSKRGVLNLMRNLRRTNTERATFQIPGETRLLGLLLSKVIGDQEGDAVEFAQTLDQSRIPRFKTIIPYTRATHLCPEQCVPVEVFDPADRAGKLFAKVTEEMEAMLLAA